MSGAATIVTKPNVEELARRILDAREQELSRKITKYARNNPILSDIGDCDRQMAYGVLEWEKRKMFDTDVQARLDAGNLWEKEIVKELLNLGFNVSLSQQPVKVLGKGGIVLATGRIDGMIEVKKGESYPFEIKSMSPNIYNGVKSIEDFQKKPWLRKYVRQLQMYLFGNDKEAGLFIVTDCLGHWKIFPLYLDYEGCEVILRRLEKVQESIKAKVLPERIPYNSMICESCPFVQDCLPDTVSKGALIVDLPELEEKLERREVLKVQAKEYEELDEEVKELAKKNDQDMLVGNFQIILRKGERTVYDVPQELKLAHARKEPTVTVKISKSEVVK